MDRAAALLSAKEWISITQLSRHWSRELSLAAGNLQNAILEAAYGGEFDELPDGHGFCISETTDPVVYSTKGSALRSRMKAFTDDGGNAAEWLKWALQSEILILHRDAVLLFASKRKLSDPSWWVRSTATELPIVTASKTALEMKLREVASHDLTAGEVKERVLAFFKAQQRHVTDAMWRVAWKKVPKIQKRSKGERLKSENKKSGS